MGIAKLCSQCLPRFVFDRGFVVRNFVRMPLLKDVVWSLSLCDRDGIIRLGFDLPMAPHRFEYCYFRWYEHVWSFNPRRHRQLENASLSMVRHQFEHASAEDRFRSSVSTVDTVQLIRWPNLDSLSLESKWPLTRKRSRRLGLCLNDMYLHHITSGMCKD